MTAGLLLWIVFSTKASFLAREQKTECSLDYLVWDLALVAFETQQENLILFN